jgi:glycosyltransferase involved in cell wall biosynthesis
MRLWDRASADRVDAFVANSAFVASRIRKIYRRDAAVVHPPVDVMAFDPGQPRGSHYLVLGQLVRYKRAELAVQAFNELGLPLVVIGEGEQMAELKRLARPNVQLIGRQPFEVIREQLQTCRALVFPGVEDFGIVPVEAMAAGAPVIAFARGGACETVRDGITGVWFDEPSVDALKAAVGRIESGALRFDPRVLHQHALAFDRTRFLREMQALIQRTQRDTSRGGVALAKPAVVLGHADVDETAVQRGRAHGAGRDQPREHVRLE